MHAILLLGALAMPGVPELLQEPDYEVVRDGDAWVVRKPELGGRRPITISRHPDRSAAESRKRALPRLRLSGPVVRFNPATNERIVSADWTMEEDARQIEADVREIVDRCAPPGLRALRSSTPLYLARLLGATGHTAEESTDPTRFVVYLDPFRATGRLHAAATIVHELAHVERFRARGFHANRAAAVLPKGEFVLLGLADELAAYTVEASLVQGFLEKPENGDVRTAAPRVMRRPEFRWPLALSTLLGFAGFADRAGQIREARRQVVLDLARIAGRYWDGHHTDSLDPALRQTILTWYKQSREWKEISAERSAWRKAESGLSLVTP